MDNGHHATRNTHHVFRLLAMFVLLAATLVAASMPAARGASTLSQPSDISYWGMNLYLTKRERLSAGDNLALLAESARNAGVQWTREELPWDLIEPSKGNFKTVYDSSLKFTAEQGFGIVGMLLTTPAWARDGACASSYWCPPANVNDFAQFAAWMAERYDGDGLSDAPGSPRVAAWQIWNEPNDLPLWPDVGGNSNARKRRYGELLVAAYAAIKAADPTATVVLGGVYIFNGHDDGLEFLNGSGGVFQQVPAARRAFDVFAIHPYIPTERPDAPNIPRLITVEGRIRNTRSWLDSAQVGRADAPLWVTEIGWCTATGACPGGVQVSEAQQADYLIRSMVIAQHNGVQHTSWFQFEDAFDDPNRLWGNAAIVHNLGEYGYPVKPAYTAYQTLAAQLGRASVAGQGPLHTHAYDPNQPNVNDNGIYDYRYACGTSTLDVLWRPIGTAQLAFPAIAGKQLTLIRRDGSQQVLQPSSGTVALTLSESPLILRQSDPPRLRVAPLAITLLAQLGDPAARGGIAIENSDCTSVLWSASASHSAIALSAAGGSTPAFLGISANTQGLPLGTANLGSITITGTNGTGTFQIPVQVKVVSTLYRSYVAIARR